MIKTIIMDCGGVVIHFNHKLAYMGLSHYTKYSPSDIQKILENSRIIKRYAEGKISSKEFYSAICRRLKLENISFRKFSEIWTHIFWPNRPVERIIKELYGRYRLVLLSNTCAMHFSYEKKNYPLLKLFDAKILSYKVGASKPSKSIFMLALKKARAKRDECIFIDDFKENVRAAEKLGMIGMLYRSPKHLIKDLKRFGIKT